MKNSNKKIKINLPTKITLARIIAIIFLLIFLITIEIITTANPSLVEVFSKHVGNTSINLIYLIVCIVFIIASLTDMLDGYIARKYNMVTDLGKFLDPVADKLLVNSMIIFLTFPHAYVGTAQTTFPLFCAILIVARDIVVDCLRFVAAKKNVVIAANIFGKAKTVMEMITIPLFFLNGWPFTYLDKMMKVEYHQLRIVSFFAYITTIVSIISGVIYVISNRKVFIEDESSSNKKLTNNKIKNITPSELISILKERNLTIGSVESLTAGEFISTLASVPGASSTIKGGLITYQSSFKTSLLGVSKKSIDKYGVVSKEVAKAMVSNASKLLNTDIVVSFTGNAGPSKEIGKAEVGRVYFAILCKLQHNKIKVFTNIYKGDRNSIRSDVVQDSINQVYKLIKSSPTLKRTISK